MTEAFIVGGVRTAIGSYGGALSSVRADDLAAFARKLSGLTAFVAQRGRSFVTA